MVDYCNIDYQYPVLHKPDPQRPARGFHRSVFGFSYQYHKFDYRRSNLTNLSTRHVGYNLLLRENVPDNLGLHLLGQGCYIASAGIDNSPHLNQLL